MPPYLPNSFVIILKKIFLVNSFFRGKHLRPENPQISGTLGKISGQKFARVHAGAVQGHGEVEMAGLPGFAQGGIAHSADDLAHADGLPFADGRQLGQVGIDADQTVAVTEHHGGAVAVIFPISVTVPLAMARTELPSSAARSSPLWVRQSRMVGSYSSAVTL